MPYIVMVDDNFHHMDESARYRYGEFADGGMAIEQCRQIVDHYLASACLPGMSADELWSSYKTYGEDPFIVSVDAPELNFSAWDYARERCEVLCRGQDPTSASSTTCV